MRARYNANAKGSCSLAGGGDCNTTGYGATEIAVGYAYFFTPSAQVYLHFARIQNDRNAQYTFPVGGSPAVAGSTPKGADPQAVGLGIRYASDAVRHRRTAAPAGNRNSPSSDGRRGGPGGEAVALPRR
jgi:hypothetical protein